MSATKATSVRHCLKCGGAVTDEQDTTRVDTHEGPRYLHTNDDDCSRALRVKPKPAMPGADEATVAAGADWPSWLQGPVAEARWPGKCGRCFTEYDKGERIGRSDEYGWVGMECCGGE